ncbi:MAG TPA: P-loop NTPase fold protein, partial [Candidatus Angelobacter sp.]|nr:P-loop NTPase fold protein [Candidatus Angelobacter sp.]
MLQPLRPDPVDSSWRNSVLYPHETNPYARLQAVKCDNDYACRLNSVAVNGADALSEVWAVGNVGLVLHRAAGQTKWEQLAINAVEANAPPKPSPLPTPRSTPEKNSAGARPAPTPTPTPIAAPTPTPDTRAPVPYLMGLSEAEARKIAESQGFTVAVEYESGGNAANQSAQSKAPSLSTQQSAPPRQVVVKQSPEPKALAPQKSTITITMGRAPRSAASLLDKLLPTVYAAELEKQPKSQGTSGPHLSREQTRRALTAAPNAKPVPLVLSPLDDDLLHVACESGECRIFGRSGRIYKAVTSTNWSFITARFSGVPAAELDSFSLAQFTPDGQAVYGEGGGPLYKCDFHASDKAPLFTCGVSIGKGLDLRLPEGRVLQRFLIPSDSNGIAFSPVRVVANRQYATDLPEAFGDVLSAAFNSKLAVVVGEHGTILASTDNGGTWLHETQGPDGVAPNRKLPALWYWLLAGLLMGISSVVVAIPVVPPAAEVSVADWAVTDAPLKPGDIDSLNFTPMALGLSRFIRNPKTQPPVTIAIEGEWGEGKSSVMSLLEGDLKKSRYCPVWFNAWHYQSEEQLLAALLEHVKDQAIPPWWHIDNWIFRARLLGNRMKLKWPLVAVLAIVFVSSAAYEIASHGIDEFIQSPTNLIPYKDQILSLFKSKDKADQSSKDKPGEAASAGAKASGTQSSAQEPSGQKPCNPGDKCDPGDLRHLGLIASFFGLLGAILKIAKAFGIDSSKLTDNLRDVTTIKDV